MVSRHDPSWPITRSCDGGLGFLSSAGCVRASVFLSACPFARCLLVCLPVLSDLLLSAFLLVCARGVIARVVPSMAATLVLTCLGARPLIE